MMGVNKRIIAKEEPLMVQKTIRQGVQYGSRMEVLCENGKKHPEIRSASYRIFSVPRIGSHPYDLFICRCALTDGLYSSLF